MPVVRTIRDQALMARVVSRWPLRYAEGANPAEDRPAHVRAGSGMAWFGGRIAVVQDDTNFVALIDPTTREVTSVALPRGPGGLRQFGDHLRNKKDKLDLESCVVASIAGGKETLVAFGSGSTSEREHVLVLEENDGEYGARVVRVPALYAALRACKEFSGSELNVEGAVLSEGKIRFFQRGNGARKDGVVSPSGATCDVEWSAVMSVLEGGGGLSGEARRLLVHDVRQFDLGEISGTPLTFTDATLAPGGATLYLATAEASPDAVQDGPVAGTVLGVISGTDSTSTLLVDGADTPFVEKAEGVLFASSGPDRVLIVLDADDPARPSELCEVVLSGPWPWLRRAATD